LKPTDDSKGLLGVVHLDSFPENCRIGSGPENTVKCYVSQLSAMYRS